MIECEAFLGGTQCVPREKLAFRPSVYGIILHDSRILLMTNHRTGLYALPGGGIELGERIADALKREVIEETGLEIEIQECVSFGERMFYYDPGDLAFHAFLFFYRCRPLTLDLIDDAAVNDEEATRPRWVEIAALGEHNAQGVTKDVLDWLEQFA